MPTRAVLFDLDETLVRDGDATRDALRATATIATKRGLDADALAAAAWLRALDGWRHSPQRDYFSTIGVSAGETLWGRFVGEDPRLRPVARWAIDYQYETWRHALADLGAQDDMLAAMLSERFRMERRERHGWLFPETRAVLDRLRGRYPLALITNGAPDVQRDKLAGSGLEAYFAVVTVSGEAGIGKPNPAIFEQTLAALDIAPEEAVMIGDKPETDILGANRAGVCAIWIRREGQALHADARPDATIATLEDLPALL